MTGRRVAIKLAAGIEEREAVRRRFEREAAALSVISSAHVVELIIWAIAHVTLALLTGEAYWTASTANQVMDEIEAHAPDRPSLRWSWLPAKFDDWFLRSTQRVPERRFRSVAVQAAQLSEALRDVLSPKRGVSPAQPRDLDPSRRRAPGRPRPQLPRVRRLAWRPIRRSG